MSEDLIRRSDAIKAIEPYLDYIEIIPLCGAKPYVREAVCGIRSKIKFIPTIELKHGEWAERTHNTLIAQVNFAYCSECGQPIMHEHTRPLWSFCPNCGADMREREGE